ncbi:hypothetical protein JCM8547_002497 [Rhodosporidiobolus lusitaniae]
MSLDFYYDHWFPLYFVPAPMLRKCDYYSLANFLFNRYTNPSDDERARERRILAFNRCNLSGLLGMRPFDSKDKARKKEDKQIIGMLFATAAASRTPNQAPPPPYTPAARSEGSTSPQVFQQQNASTMYPGNPPPPYT